MCEDYPCCGHEMNDCNGQKYGTDESIKMRVWDAMKYGVQDWELDDLRY